MTKKNKIRANLKKISNCWICFDFRYAVFACFFLSQLLHTKMDAVSPTHIIQKGFLMYFKKHNTLKNMTNPVMAVLIMIHLNLEYWNIYVSKSDTTPKRATTNDAVASKTVNCMSRFRSLSCQPKQYPSHSYDTIL